MSTGSCPGTTVESGDAGARSSHRPTAHVALVRMGPRTDGPSYGLALVWMGPRPRQSIRPFAVDRGAPPMDHPQDASSGATASVKISVVTSVHNRAGTIGETVASVRRQTHAAVEHIVQDGGSRDGTRDVLARLAAPGMQVESAPDRGIYDGINRGIARATGEVVGLMHSDDLFAADDILARVAETFATQEVDGVYGDLVYVSAANPARVIRYWNAGLYHPDRLRRGWMPPHPTLYLRRDPGRLRLPGRGCVRPEDRGGGPYRHLRCQAGPCRNRVWMSRIVRAFGDGNSDALAPEALR